MYKTGGCYEVHLDTFMFCFSVYIYNDLPIPEFFILLHRSQNSRMDDQRGLLDQKNIELPDFLKIQEAPKKRNDPLLVGVPSPRPAHHQLTKTISSPPSYATWVSKQQSTQPPVMTEKSRETLSKFTRNWSGSALGRGKVHAETVTESQTIDRKRFFKHSQNETVGRLRAGSLPHTHPNDRCNDTAGGNEFRTRTRYHYESEMSLNNNKAEVVWVSNTLNKNRVRSSTKPDPLGDAGYESTTDDEGVSRNFPKAEVIVPLGNTNSDQLAMSGSVVPFRSSATSQYFCENMATAKRHVRTLAEQSTAHALTSGNDRQAILDNSFLRDQLKPSRLFSQLSPELNSLITSSPKERNGTPMKCPLFIPPGNSYTPGDDFTETGTSCGTRDNHAEAVSIEPRVCWQANEPANEEGNVRVTFV